MIEGNVQIEGYGGEGCQVRLRIPAFIAPIRFGHLYTERSGEGAGA